ncbi:10705_t:CDS:2 [Acaulospora morrowiae]|uniref:10705_t:CDS:1 n=1 Tax=Acaulospora morrowiae TaxID=94023 RepID=A0A9N8VZ17_9GLOM|nr:10705_t:CDS:2 [Acaulospora morrowiae]
MQDEITASEIENFGTPCNFEFKDFPKQIGFTGWMNGWAKEEMGERCNGYMGFSDGGQAEFPLKIAEYERNNCW